MYTSLDWFNELSTVFFDEFGVWWYQLHFLSDQMFILTIYFFGLNLFFINHTVYLNLDFKMVILYMDDIYFSFQFFYQQVCEGKI
jgi:hypothetical protein